MSVEYLNNERRDAVRGRDLGLKVIKRKPRAAVGVHTRSRHAGGRRARGDGAGRPRRRGRAGAWAELEGHLAVWGEEAIRNLFYKRISHLARFSLSVDWPSSPTLTVPVSVMVPFALTAMASSRGLTNTGAIMSLSWTFLGTVLIMRSSKGVHVEMKFSLAAAILRSVLPPSELNIRWSERVVTFCPTTSGF